MSLAAHGATHPGRRSSNEDALLVDLRLGLFIVADGMGGHNAGEVASSLAVQTVHRLLAAAARPTPELLEEAILAANEHILTEAAREPDYSGMGTTVVAALAGPARVSYTSVGDSRVYLWQRSTLTQLTRDDSWSASAFADASAADHRELQQHPLRHVLTRVVGLRPELRPTVAECGWGRGDTLLLCSDGLHGALPDSVLAEVLGSGASVMDVADVLVERAVAEGATDNVTVVVVRRE